MRQKNYEVRYEDYKTKEGKILAFKADGQKYYVYAEKLGWYYEEAQLKTRIERCILRRQQPKQFVDDGRIKKLIDINNNEKFQQSAGLERWARIKNLQEASRTINWLSERGITDVKNIDNAGSGIYEKHIETASEIKALEQRMGELLVRKKNVQTYQKLKPVNNEYLTTKNRDKYFREHESELLIFESVKKALKA